VSTTEKHQKGKRDTTKAEGEIAGHTAEASKASANHFEEVEPGIRPAYYAYLEARRGLEKAFEGREHEDDEAYKDAQRRYQLCEEAMERAMKEREKAERDALDIYRETVDKAVKNASYAYRERMKQALSECEHKMEQVWRTSWETSAEMTKVFHSDDGNTDRQKKFHGGTPGQEHQRGPLRESMLQWKSKCAIFIRQALRPLGRSVGWRS
jgi:hypothetical protein